MQEELEKEEQIARAMMNDEIYTTPTPVPGANDTWVQAQELKVGMPREIHSGLGTSSIS